MSTWYDRISLNNNERAILMETIEIDDQYKNRTGKFTIPVLMPDLSMTSKNPKTKPMAAPQVQLVSTAKKKIKPKKYSKANYVELKIPRYIMYQFDNIIPKGTTFLITDLGEDLDINNIKIIGID